MLLSSQFPVSQTAAIQKQQPIRRDVNYTPVYIAKVRA